MIAPIFPGFSGDSATSINGFLGKIKSFKSKLLDLTNASNPSPFSLYDVPFMGKVRSLSKSSKAKDVLGWNPRPAEESILDVANQIKEMGLIN